MSDDLGLVATVIAIGLGVAAAIGLHTLVLRIRNGLWDRKHLRVRNIALGVTVSREIMSGQPCIAGTRIPTALVRRVAVDGWDVAKIIEQYPSLNAGAVVNALAYEQSIGARVRRFVYRCDHAVTSARDAWQESSEW